MLFLKVVATMAVIALMLFVLIHTLAWLEGYHKRLQKKAYEEARLEIGKQLHSLSYWFSEYRDAYHVLNVISHNYALDVRTGAQELREDFEHARKIS